MRNIGKKLTILAGDWASLYVALFLLMVIRYKTGWETSWETHLRPFSLLFPVWIIALYGAYLYETRFIRFGIDTVRAISSAVGIALVTSVTAFYIFPPGLIYPRRNMVIFALVYAIVLVAWRWLFYKTVGKTIETRILFVGGGNDVKELRDYFKENPHLGYKSMDEIDKLPEKTDEIIKRIEDEAIGLVVIKGVTDGQSKENIFPLLSSGATVIAMETFYERVLNKVSTEVFSDLWFIRNLENINLDAYKFIKRLGDIAFGAMGLALFAILYIPVAIAIKLDSDGPVLFSQTRTGKNNKDFKIYKFRTMKALGKDGSAETDGPKWADENDSRITRTGAFLRKTRLDELPQFWNILVGSMSFVGPRPERPEFVKKLSQKIPYYNMRHLVRPGLTGWAQINYEYGNSVDDARIKLQYDIYYAKRRSIAIDLAIIIKTVRTVLTRQGQ